MRDDNKQLNNNVVDAELFERLMICGATNLHANIEEVNNLNVFPVPDGDTGDNMYLTIKGGVDELCSNKNATLEDKARALSNGMLLNARGNSGVILSQLFSGLADGLIGRDSVTIEEFVQVLEAGVKRAYGAVAEPVEGTILTVAREAVEGVKTKIFSVATVEDFCRSFLVEMQKSLEHTPELLRVLKEAQVIDSGGAGLVYIIEGFCKAFNESIPTDEIAVTVVASKKLDFSKFNEDSVMTYGYCTELLLQLQNAKTDVRNFSIKELTAFLETIGDSIVAFITGTVVKIHVHTLAPYKVLEYCQRYGEFLTVKIENMTLQHNESIEDKPQPFSASAMSKKVKKERKKFGVVTVASGEGIKKLFLDMGVDFVINGGQTNNPSAEDFIDAYDEVNADCIFVFPNNGNIVLSAKQSAQIYKNSEIRVIESKSLGEGYTAISMFDSSIGDADEIEQLLKDSMSCVVTAMVTTAVRDTTLNGVTVKEGDYIGFTNHTMLVSTSDKIKSANDLLDKLEVADKNYLIVIYGKSATPVEREAIKTYMQNVYEDVEFYEVDGEQDVYDFIFIVE